MAYDYSADIAFALELIAEYGRTVSFNKVASGVNPTDPLGPPVDVAPPAVAGVKAVFVYPTGLTNLGISTNSRKLMKEAEQIALIGSDGVNDFTTFDTITDTDGSVWAISAVDMFKPGDVAVLYYVGVKRP